MAEGHYLSDELVIHYGLVPRTNRGIFCINELPDLAERIQVGLFNLMEERDVQIKGYRVRLPLDVFVVATANPEDYTNRGRIVTPLKDRYGSQIHTHYPQDPRDEIAIMDQERNRFPDEEKLVVPGYIKEILAEITAQARQSSEINQRSGVSVRVSIANFETMLGNAVRRSLINGEEWVCPRVSDLTYIVASFAGKIELETFEEGRESRVTDDLTRRAVLRVFGGYFDLEDLETGGDGLRSRWNGCDRQRPPGSRLPGDGGIHRRSRGRREEVDGRRTARGRGSRRRIRAGGTAPEPPAELQPLRRRLPL